VQCPFMHWEPWCRSSSQGLCVALQETAAFTKLTVGDENDIRNNENTDDVRNEGIFVIDGFILNIVYLATDTIQWWRGGESIETN